MLEQNPNYTAVSGSCASLFKNEKYSISNICEMFKNHLTTLF